MNNLEFFILEDEVKWLDNHKAVIEAALTVPKFDRRTKTGDDYYHHNTTHATNYDEGVQKTNHKKFDSYLIDGRFPMHKGEDYKHLLGVQFAKYLMSQGVPIERIFFVSSQYSMLQGAVEAGLPNVFKKGKIENEGKLSPKVRHYGELINSLKSALAGYFKVTSPTAKLSTKLR